MFHSPCREAFNIQASQLPFLKCPHTYFSIVNTKSHKPVGEETMVKFIPPRGPIFSDHVQGVTKWLAEFL